MPFIYLEPLPPRATKSELIGFVCDKGEIDRRHIGRVDLRGKQASVEVPEGWDTRLAKSLDGAAFGTGRVRAWTGASHRSVGSSQESDAHFIRLARLLELESQAEERQNSERL